MINADSVAVPVFFFALPGSPGEVLRRLRRRISPELAVERVKERASARAFLFSIFLSFLLRAGSTQQLAVFQPASFIQPRNPLPQWRSTRSTIGGRSHAFTATCVEGGGGSLTGGKTDCPCPELLLVRKKGRKTQSAQPATYFGLQALEPQEELRIALDPSWRLVNSDRTSGELL